MPQLKAYRTRLDLFQNILWRVEHSIEIEDNGEAVSVDERHLQPGDTLNIYRHLYSASAESSAEIVQILTEFMSSTMAEAAAGLIMKPAYLLNISVSQKNLTAPFSAKGYLRDAEVQMGGPFKDIDTPRMSLLFHDDIDTTTGIPQGTGKEKKLTMVLLKDTDNGVAWSEAKAEALRELKFADEAITHISTQAVAAYWVIHTQEDSNNRSGNRGIPDDAQGTATGTM